MLTPSLEEFTARSRSGNLVPVYREILADTETPVSAYLKVGNRPHSFLLESVEGGERIGRYSFIGGEPFLVLKTRGNQVEIARDGRCSQRDLERGEDPLHVLEGLMSGLKFVRDEDLPPFCGGAVGYIGYDTVRFFERLPERTRDELDLPDTYFVLTDTLLIFDHVRRKIKVLCNARVDGDPAASYAAAAAKIDRLIEKLRAPLDLAAIERRRRDAGGFQSDLTRSRSSVAGPRTSTATAVSLTQQGDYEAAVRAVKEYIAAGDCIQVVLSQRLAAPITAPPFDLYRALRSVNPSPYMFFLQFEDCQLVGSSPEILVTEREGTVTTRPIAGTVRRGKNPVEDETLIRHLLADPKERAEHVMLVDLHRNDIGRVCEFGSVVVDELMTTEKYSHVIHMVSNVVGRLRTDKTACDVLRAAFPAGTVSGAPKVRAMEIIEELEPLRRGPYGGAIGYFSFSGDMDTCIILRTIVVKGDTAYVQAGAGIVADSIPEREHQECMSKAGAMLRAIEMAEAGLE
jgi:anthranilate synthase component 1